MTGTAKLVRKLQDGRVWLNIIRAENSVELFTINRNFKSNGGWVNSPFFRQDKGDLASIRRLLDEYEHSKLSNATTPEPEEPVEQETESMENEPEQASPLIEFTVRCGDEYIPCSPFYAQNAPAQE